ncbi:hypothetical protein ACSZMD_08730 [Aeromonas veronii]
MDSGIEMFIAGGLVVWLAGYGSGTTFRYVRQIFEKAARGG